MTAFIKANFQYDGHKVTIGFPCTENELCAKLTELHAPEDSLELCLVQMEFPSEFTFMENTFVNLDELNFLAKRMDSFFGDEEWQFFEAMKLEKFSSLKDLINLSFNLDKYTLIQNIGDMQKVGVDYTMNTQGSMLTAEMNDPKYAALGRKLLQSGDGAFTEHGLLFKDSSRPFEELYDGQVFPGYVYDSGVLVIAAASYNEKTEYLYLPCESLAIDKAIRRLGAGCAEDCDIELEDFAGNNPTWAERMKELCRTERIDEVNKLADAIRNSGGDLNKLNAAAEYADADSAKDLTAIAEHLDEFVFIRDIKDYEDVGRFYANNDHEYSLDPEMEDFFDFNGFGEYMAEKNGGEFISSGFVCMQDNADLSDILDADETLTMGGI